MRLMFVMNTFTQNVNITHQLSHQEIKATTIQIVWNGLSCAYIYKDYKNNIMEAP